MDSAKFRLVGCCKVSRRSSVYSGVCLDFRNCSLPVLQGDRESRKMSTGTVKQLSAKVEKPIFCKYWEAPCRWSHFAINRVAGLANRVPSISTSCAVSAQSLCVQGKNLEAATVRPRGGFRERLRGRWKVNERSLQWNGGGTVSGSAATRRG